MAKLSRENRMMIKSLIGRECSNRHIARLLVVTEGTVRYHGKYQDPWGQILPTSTVERPNAVLERLLATQIADGLPV